MFKVDTVKSFTVVDEAAIHVLVVFNLFLTDQPHVHDLVMCSAVFPEVCTCFINHSNDLLRMEYRVADSTS